MFGRILTRAFPFLAWFQDYSARDFRADLLSGLTVALVLIPQSMAYAQLAGLPPWYGLYASFLPPMVAALFGSSRQLATGPVAVVSLMTAASLEPLATAGSEAYIAYAVVLALIVGLFQLSLGVLRLGLVVNFLSHPVVNGFTHAAAIIIATSQLSKLFGVYVDKGAHHYETVIRVVEAAFHYTHFPTLIMGALAFAVMFGFKRFFPRAPGVLIAVAGTTLLSWALGFHRDHTVPLDAVHAPALRTAILAFNEAAEALPVLSRQRTEAYRKLEQARTGGDTRAVLQAEHEIRMCNLNMEESREKVALYRARIRSFLLAGVEGCGEGGVALYPRDGLPAGEQGDGRTWRVRVGNKPLDTARIPVSGGGAVVGAVPGGLPSFAFPPVNLGMILQLLPYAAIISLLGFMEAISIAKAMAAKTGQRLDPNQELIGQGLANMAGSLFRSYPTSGSFSRSAVNLQAGAKTGLSSVFTSLAVVTVLLFFTPLLYPLPQAVLAAVIMMAVLGLIDPATFVHAWKAQWYDGAISVVTFLCTLAFAPHLDKGIMVGVVLSLLVFLYKSMRPSVSSLARDRDNALRDASVHRLGQCRFIDLIRFEGPLFFANATYLEDKITERLRARKELRHLIIASNGINDMDATGAEALSLIVDTVRSSGVDISFSGVNDRVMEVLERTHLL